MFMAKKSRARRVGGYFKKKYHTRRKSGIMSGVMGTAISGAIWGVGIKYGSPMLSSKVPMIGPVHPTTVAVLGVSALDKFMLHKGGKFTDVGLGLGVAMLTMDVANAVNPNGANATSGNTAVYG
jgi:hypothetical protein